MKKRFLSLLLAAVMLCGIMPAQTRAASVYTISAADAASGTAQVNAGETVKLRVTVTGRPFNGMEAVLTYNTALLRLESAVGEAVSNTVNDGEVELYTLRHEPYTSGDCVAELVFTALGDSTEKEAAISFRAGAVAGDYASFKSGDAVPAVIAGDAVAIKPHSVIKPDLFWGNSGVKHGGTYVFGAADDDYSYGLPSATMGGKTVEVSVSGTNMWKISNVTGDVVIADPRSEKE